MIPRESHPNARLIVASRFQTHNSSIFHCCNHALVISLFLQQGGEDGISLCSAGLQALSVEGLHGLRNTLPAIGTGKLASLLL